MANFSTNMREWSGGYAPARTVSADKSSDAWGELASKIVPAVIDAVGKGYARAKGANITGASTTAEEALTAVNEFDAAVPFTDDPSNTPDQKARIEDMRQAALKKFGTDDKKIQALVTSGKISTIEANARRHQMLQEHLSNPVLAMFKDDFLDASTAFTGGGGKAVEQYWGAYLPTEEEKVTAEANAKIVTAKAEYEERIAQIQISHPDMSREAAIGFIQESAAKEVKLAQAEYDHKMRAYTSQESYVAGMEVVDSFSFNTLAQLAQYTSSGKKIDDPAAVLGQIELAAQAAYKRLQQFASTMTPEDYTKARSALKQQVDIANKIVEDADSFKSYEKAVKRLKLANEATQAKAFAKLAANFGDVLMAYDVGEKFGEMYVAAESGDYGGKMWLKTNPLAQRIAGTLKHVNFDGARTDALGKIINNQGEGWTMAEGVAVVDTMLSGGNMVGATEGLSKAPEAARAALRVAASNPEMSLEHFSSSDSFMVNSRTPEGAKLAAIAIKEFVSKAKGAQVASGSGLPKNIEIKGTPQIDSFTGEPTGEVHYQFNTKLSDAAKKELAHAYKILTKSPQTLKELGYSTPEDFIRNAFSN